jgi:hypothetical protein
VRAPEILDHKADLMTRLQNPDVYRSWRGQVEMDIRWEDQSGPVPLNDQRRASNRSNAAAIITTLRDCLPEAECFHVNEDMTALVQFAATQLDESDRFRKLMLPSRSGIVRFEGGIPWTDVRGKSMRLSWAVWGPILARHGRHDVGEPDEYTHFWLFNDHFVEPDEIAHELMHDFEERGRRSGWAPGEGVAQARRIWGRWGFMGGEYMSEGERLGPAMRVPPEAKMAEILDSGGVPHNYTNPRRLLHALWLLLGQTITQTDEAHLDRSRRKRAGRAGIPPRVTVVQLRNVESRRSEGETYVEWSHRWIVRGHPAWRQCGPNHPLAEPYPDDPTKFRVRVWIAPFQKGPADKPLVLTEHVYALHR